MNDVEVQENDVLDMLNGTQIDVQDVAYRLFMIAQQVESDIYDLDGVCGVISDLEDIQATLEQIHDCFPDSDSDECLAWARGLKAICMDAGVEDMDFVVDLIAQVAKKRREELGKAKVATDEQT